MSWEYCWTGRFTVINWQTPRVYRLPDLRFHGLSCGKFPISVWFGAWGTSMQFTSFPDRCTASSTRHG